jgi:hypothetical protein
LQVGKDAGDGVAPAGVDGSFERSFWADENRAGDEELGNIDVERGLWGAQRGC